MSRQLDRAFRVLEHLSMHPEGVPVSSLAAELDIPLSATHRLLTELIQIGYVRQSPDHGLYQLTIRLVSLGLGYLSSTGVVDIAQPLLDELASETGELVRLAVVDGNDLTFVAKAQGATRGLRYDADMGLSVALSCSAAGHAWLSTMTDEQALALVLAQGFGSVEDYGPGAPQTVDALLECIHATRARGYSVINEMFSPGMTAMAAPVRRHDGQVVGVVTVAGPLIRLSEARMQLLAPTLLRIAGEISRNSGVSPLFRSVNASMRAPATVGLSA